MCWPVFFRDSLTKGNMESNVAICTLWTEQREIIKSLDPDSFSVIGNMYYKDGIGYIIRNIFLNPKIRHLIICGKDISGSSDALVKFFESGTDEDNMIIGTDIAIDRNIPKNFLDFFRQNVKLIDMRGKEKSVMECIGNLEKMDAFTEPTHFPVDEPIPGDTLPSYRSVFVTRKQKIADAWLDILHYVMSFGVIKDSEHSLKQKELVDMVNVIEGEDPDNPEISPVFRFTREDLFSYYPQVMLSRKIDGISYTYGERLRSNEGINQIQNIISQLRKTPHTRRAIATTWNLKKDASNEHPPCWVLVQAIIQQNSLHLTSFIRSNDMFGAWPQNAFALRKIQKEIADGVGVVMGDLVIISCSAHIYENCWQEAGKILSKYRKVKNDPEFDPRGNFIIERRTGAIKVRHQSPDGKDLQIFVGKSAKELYKQIIHSSALSDPFHAAYLGMELARAESALKKNEKYVQDKA